MGGSEGVTASRCGRAAVQVAVPGAGGGGSASVATVPTVLSLSLCEGGGARNRLGGPKGGSGPGPYAPARDVRSPWEWVCVPPTVARTGLGRRSRGVPELRGGGSVHTGTDPLGHNLGTKAGAVRGGMRGGSGSDKSLHPRLRCPLPGPVPRTRCHSPRALCPLVRQGKGYSPAEPVRVSPAGQGGVGHEQGDVAVPLSPHPDPPRDPLAMLRESPFPNRGLAALEWLSEGLLAPSFWALNGLLDLRPTTEERGRWGQRRCGRCRSCTGRILAVPGYAGVMVLGLPLAVLGLLLWLPVQAVRRPFAYQYVASTEPGQPWDLRQRRSLTLLSANLCLLPSGLAKFTGGAAAPLGRGIRGDTQHGGGGSAIGAGTIGTSVHRAGATGPEAREAVPVPLSDHFPSDADIICLQEVFDSGAATILRRQLGGTFPHVLHGVGGRGLRGGQLKLLDSGLLLASRYQPLAARFHSFPNGAGEDALAAKGLLVVQVLLGSVRGRRVVGYVGCTHLQAPAGDATIREAQVTLALGWLQRFQQEQEQPGDLVAFDIFCGDLNFDNCSRGDQLNQRHRLFEVYQDPCRQGPGQDVPWAIGTLLNYLKIYEEPVSTPERMKRTLSQPGGRQQFLAAPILSSGHPDPAAPAPWQGRRVDYILHRPPHGAAPLRSEVAGVSFITQLATCSDHLPVALRLNITPTRT
ncbi:sphingomyelin phosphodiesterase 5-like [Calypte anna]|uniref:sphingomyelin phosphodiesterase 5-like n=1 Tax=Calypte anna TaxID=9244 RepID=UPI0011C413BF|nr:sphingomyelin phosphodiesterase 5-like [Calypte anna]